MVHSRILTAALAAGALTGALTGIGQAQQFTYNAASLPAQNIWTDGVALADIDGDTDLDILFANGNTYGGAGAAGAQPQHLFLNNGSATFTAAHAQLNVANFNAKMVIAEDFDGDLDLDLMYASGSTGSPPRILINNGSGTFADGTATRIPFFAANPRSFCVCAGDVDGDLDLDVVVTDGGTFGGVASQAILLLNNGSGFFSNATATNMPADLYNCQDATLFDYDGDYDLDIALSGKGGTGKRGRLYLNNGSGVFAISTIHDALGTGSTYEIDWGDLDLDGDLDGLVQSISGVNEGAARNNGVAVAPTAVVFPMPNGNDDNEMAGLDYDNDGDLDCLIGSLGGTERMYRNDGILTWVNVNAVIQAQGDSTLDLAVGDLNNDNRYDFVTAQGEANFVDKVYLNNGPADTRVPNFLKIETPSLGVGSTVFHVITQDAIQDDAKTGYVVTTYNWERFGSSSHSEGSGTAFHQGGGTWAVSVPTAGDTLGICMRWTATDRAGNSAATQVVVGAGFNGYIALAGTGIAGVTGVPGIAGVGLQIGGAANTVTLTNAAPSSPGAWVASSGFANLPLLGGILVPNPDIIQPFVTTGVGGATLNFNWPASLSNCDSAFFQGWTLDGAAVSGFSASNGLRAVAP